MLHWAPCWQISIAFFWPAYYPAAEPMSHNFSFFFCGNTHVLISLLVDFLTFGCRDITTLEGHLPCSNKYFSFTHITWSLQFSSSVPLCFIISGQGISRQLLFEVCHSPGGMKGGLTHKLSSWIRNNHFSQFIFQSRSFCQISC